MASGGEVKHFIKGDLVMGDYGEARRASLPSGSTVVDDFGNVVEKNGKKIKPPIKPSMYSRVLRKVPYLGAALTAAEGIQALVDSDTGTASEFLDPIAAMQGTQGGYERPIKKDVYAEMKEDIRAENAPKPKPSVTANNISRDFDTTSEGIPSAPVLATPAVAPKTAFEMFMEQNDLDRAALGKQRSEDRNMALLAAGLGMLGGESPYAFTNIGKGGLSGVSYLSEANKQRAAEKAALDKNRVAAMHYGNVGDYYKSQVLDKEERQKLGQQKLEETAFQNATRYKDMMMNRLKAEGFDSTLIALLPANDPQRKAFNQRLLEIENDPYYLAQLRKAGMPLKEQSTAPVSTQGFKLVK